MAGDANHPSSHGARAIAARHLSELTGPTPQPRGSHRPHLGFVLAGVLSLISGPAPVAAADAARDIAALKQRLRADLLHQLKDPESARVRGEYLSMPEQADLAVRALCGEINARNSYGGYAGFTRFIVTTDGLRLFESSEPPGAFTHVWPVWCSRPI